MKGQFTIAWVSMILISLFLSAVAFGQDSLNVRLIGQIPCPNAKDVAINGDFAYIAAASQLQIVNISDPSNPIGIGVWNTSDFLVGVAVLGNYAYATAEFGTPGLRVIDVSNPTSPSGVGSFPTFGNAKDVAVMNNYAYVADYDSGLHVVNVNIPSAPVGVGLCSTSGHNRGVTIVGNYAHVACYDLSIINISTPTTPFQVGYCNTPGSAQKVAVSGNYAYVADYNSGLQVINISNPALPVEVGNCNTSGPAEDVTVSGHFAYVASYFGGLRVINISNPAFPQEVGFYDGPGYAEGIAVSGIYAYIAENTFFSIYDCSAALAAKPFEEPTLQPSSFALPPPFPNPFNPTTTISYQLPTRSHVKLEVFDVSGRLVSTLIDGWREAGEHEVTFDGSGLVSGVYLYRLTASGSGANPTLLSGKMVLLK